MIKRQTFRQDRCRSGATLIIVLALVTLVSILLITYLAKEQFERSATQSYSGELTANQIALSGLDHQIADLDQEIAAGSTATPGPTTTSPTYYKPVSPLAMVPARYSDTATIYTNLVRISSTNSAQYTAAFPSSVYSQSSLPVNLGVASSTLTPSPSGRYISMTRWARPQLMVSGETMPAPDWILMTRSGPTNAAGLSFGSTGNTLNNRTSSNPNYVEGRYAYAVYDEGGLLDATVAGAPSVATADETGNRGTVALAPLTNSVFSATAPPTSLISWRNLVSGATESSYTNSVYNVATTNGFLQVQPGDNTFLSRQDLIAYANYQSQNGNAAIQTALPYLGTFNRSLNAPAYIPPAAVTPNFDFLTLRFASGGTINSAGTLLQSRTVNQGDFLLTRRFPLGRLAWVTYNGPLTIAPPGQTSAPSAYDIWRAFGLVWNSKSSSWTYVSASGSSLPAPTASPVSTIKTLDVVAGENPPRDPDFFELLQAGILTGSLGQTGGVQATSGSSILGACGDVSGYDSLTTYHIMQIGANILDQASPDSYPIALTVGASAADKWVSTDTFSGGTTRTFYGVENLPYLSRLIDTYERWVTPPFPLKNTDKVANGSFPGRVYTDPYVGAWLQIELWNPHQQANLNTTSLYPTAIRIEATGTVQPQISNEYSGTLAPFVTTTWSPATTFLQLSPIAHNDFSEPTVVALADVKSAPGNFVVQGSQVTGGTSFAGLYISSEYVPDWSYCYQQAGSQNAVVAATPTTDPICVSYDKERIDFNAGTSAPFTGTTYALQYYDGHNWYTYSEIKNHTLAYLHNLPLSTQTTSGFTVANSDLYSEYFMKVDPRTDRFSLAESRASICIVNAAGNNFTPSPQWPGDPVSPSSAANATVLPGINLSGPAGTKGYAAQQAIPYTGLNATWSATSYPIPVTGASGGTISGFYLGGIEQNTPTAPCYYKDHDGTLRGGDAAYASGTDGLPGVANVNEPNQINLARPVMLNRPFRSVGELGYAFRDLPFKTLDFFTKDSGDAALLDLFSVSDANVVAGRINVNTRNPAALAEVLGGGAINPIHVNDGNASPLTSTQATTLANLLVAQTATTPVRSLAELVTSAVGSNGETILSGSPSAYTSQNSKIQREVAIRTLGEAGNARTWNLLIDIIAQSGQFPPNLSPGASFDRFIPNGEKRYWLHVAIDRFTGQVIDRFLEPVQE